MTPDEWRAHLHQALAELDFLEALLQAFPTSVKMDRRKMAEAFTTLRDYFTEELEDAQDE